MDTMIRVGQKHTWPRMMKNKFEVAESKNSKLDLKSLS